ncbi:hypothetical protein M3I54_22545 [Paraburkholderia sp. CNPSo 3274]|uniref:hypothetical protein n=1 Tax=Paraburkholderia sp. CNPSo 3274 TaxID=2940932 RepID=UPI0020B9019D|nr:hypothetical protein [Paraburkholderia sp. CNPSo 3274]MCP3709726.1 hypothetical protein [Paraburkholderia sp. CNPSo 3274]
MSASVFRQVSAATTNLAQVKPYAGNLAGYLILNTNAAARYVKLYDSTDQPVVGTTVPKLTIQIPASSEAVLSLAIPANFSHTMWMATTVNAADSDATVVGAGDLITQLLVE